MSERAQLLIRIPKDLKKELEEEAKDKGISLNEYITDILMRRNQVEHIDIEKLLKARWIVKPVPYDTYCSSCGSLIPKNADAIWIVGTKINFCLNCMRKLISNAPLDADYWRKALDAYKKYIQYKRLAQAAKKELDNLIDVINEAEARKRILDTAIEVEKRSQEIEKRIYDILDLIKQYLTTVESNIDLKQIYSTLMEVKESILTEFEEAKKKLDEIATAMINVKTKKKRKTVETWR